MSVFNSYRLKKRIKAIFVTSLLLGSGLAQAQVVIEGNVFGGGNLGQVTENTSVTINGGTIGDKIPLEDRKADETGQVKHIRYGNVYGGGNGYDGTDYSQSVPTNIQNTWGRVQGNTSVTISGDAVVRHAVFGGGNLGTVGVIDSFDEYGRALYSNGGKTLVTIEGNALIGPTKADLTKDDAGNDLLSADIDTAFKYLGANEGMVFGGSRGISGDELKELSFADTTEVIIQGNANVVGNVFGGGENGHVQKGTNVLVKEYAVIGGVELHGTSTPAEYTVSGGIYDGVKLHLTAAEGELVEDEFGVGRRIFRGNVFGGGKGNDFVPWLLPSVKQYSYSAGDVYGNATVQIEGGTIYNKVYGGGTMASVGTFQHTDPSNPHAVTGIVKNAVTNKDTGHCYVTVTGGQIGTSGLNNGEVYGGGRGTVGIPYVSGDVLPINQAIDLAYAGHTHVTIDGASIKSTVYGGSANGHVQGNAKVLIKETSANSTYIGTEGHGAWHSNVYGGGGGTARYTDSHGDKQLSITSGRVFGDTEVEITGGKIWHNVYGGGAIASVGTYNASNLVNPDHPYLGHGHAKVTITGGEIGSDGNENGMVFGSGRGEIAEPGNFLDYVTYVAYSEVNIGTGDVDPETGAVSNISGNAKINGSVYGSGENGHVYLESVVNVFAGTIGCTLAEYEAMTPEQKAKFPYRGNVYGAGCGTDEYGWETLKIPGTETPATYPGTTNPIKIGKYNPLAGITQGNTKVNIYGGYISRSVYGGGAMASVGLFTQKGSAHTNPATTFALSWPYEFEYSDIYDLNGAVTTGKTEVTVKGGHIGTYCVLASDNLYALANSGDVYGGSRGMAGNRYDFVPFANVKESVVRINYANPATEPSANGNFIVNSVFGGGENGHVYEDTKVTIDDGFIGGTVFGGGKGKDTYWDFLKSWDGTTETANLTQVHSITAGKVFGNTEVTINDGIVQHNVFGGGEYASVGIGNYFGYGELTEDDEVIALTTTTGKATVKVNGGTIGTNGHLDDYQIGNGFVYGSSKGTAFPNVDQKPGSARYDYSHDFFLGYVNESDVTIGSSTGSGTPIIWGSVFGGGEDGHVRFDTDVKVKKGTIGVAYTYSGTPLSVADSTKLWIYRGNVYGAGRGIDKIASGEHAGEYCSSAGSVTLNTNVTVEGGTIHRNVYGGGSNASVGPPPTGYDPGPSLCTVNIQGGTIGETLSSGELYGGNVFGASRGATDLLTTANIGRFATSSNTEVNIETGANVMGNVYGGGEIGQTKQEALVKMKGGSVQGSVFGAGKGDESDEMAALVLGHAIVDMTNGTVERSIYGGGQLASVGTYNYTTITYNDPGNPNGNNGKTVQVPESLKTTETGLLNPELNGLTKVLVSGGMVGNNGSLMPWDDHNPDDDDRGWIFCGGQGVADSVTYYKAIALGVVDSTYLEISNTSESVRPLITASVYGGSENGLVFGGTYVKIMGGQIGSGLQSKSGTPLVGTFDDIYDEDKWDDAIEAINDGTIETALASGGSLNGYFHECDAWEYTTPYLIYDINANKSGHPNTISGNIDYQTSSATAGTNGHSFFGNVFGGGSGYYPIATGIWRRSAGQVNGNTKVEITGGHILTAVYGGNETTDVLGKCEVVMSGGTVGIPRTQAQITTRPINGYVYGAGMGDPRNLLSTFNNVDSTNVQITGGTIFGSVFGGSKEGHVLDSTKVIVDGGLIGTTGFSGYDGNVFGGGKGKDILLAVDTLNGRRQFPVGRVGGNTHVVMKNGTVLGNLYGGGQVGLVGVDKDGWIDENVTYDATNHGLTKVDVSGGTVGNYANSGRDLLLSNEKVGNIYGGGRGNLNEFVEDDLGRVAKSVVNISGSDTKVYGSVFGGGQMANVGFWRDYEHGYWDGTSVTQVNIKGSPTIGTELEFNHDEYAAATPPPTNTVYDIVNNVKMISHTRTGNVYGGGQGNIKLDNHGCVVGLEHGHCGESNVTISGNPLIRSSVFGGSEEGAVWGDTKVTIEGGTIGTMGITSDSLNPVIPANTTGTYYFGSVYGGSYGADSYKYINNPSDHVKDSINGLAGRVYGNATVEIKGGTIRGNVFGGGNIASVGEWNSNFEPTANTGLTTVTVSGGEIGPIDGTGLNAYVVGGGKGFSSDPNEYRKTYANVNNTMVTVSGGEIKGSILGGGFDSHVLGNTEVIIHDDADIGTNGLSTYDGNIFGGGRNFQNTNHTNGRVAGNIEITMDGGSIQGSIFGGGRNALTGVDVNGGVTAFLTGQVYDSINHGYVHVNVSGGSIGNTDGMQLLTGSDESVGDIFGSGKGDTKNYEDIWAGRVAKAKVEVSGSTQIYGSVFGGGEMASIGYWSDATGHPFYQGTGMSEVIINGGTIGTDTEYSADYADTDPEDHEWTVFDETNHTLIHTCTGNVFGGCQGDVDPASPHWVSMARSRSAKVTINGGNIKSCVFGGAEQGTVTGNTLVTINGGTIGTNVTPPSGDDYIFGGVYGGGYGSHRDDYNVTHPNDSSNFSSQYIAGRVYGNTRVDLNGGEEIRGDVFGGASYAYVGYGTPGNTTLNVGSATQSDYNVLGNIYGANNHNGTVVNNVTVNINAGTLGTTTRQSNVFGGGYGESTATSGDVTVTVDSLKNVNAPIIYGDVYGGSAFGSVNDAGTDKTTVNIFAGSIIKSANRGTPFGGDVYGGGLGESGNLNKGKVFGAITVNIGDSIHQPSVLHPENDTVLLSGYATIGNNVYGANNTGGSPQDDVTVNIFGTAHTAANVADGGTEYAIQNVFGGGNYADYDPKDGEGQSVMKLASVNIFGCKNTIRRVFGGGDASASPNVRTDIQGGRFNQVFGGGNGELGPDHAANIKGNVTLGIHGGQVGMFFGGSNQNGLISGTTTIVIDDDGPCGETDIDEFFCGGNYVDVIGDVDATITCSEGMHVKRLYGGCNQALIKKKQDGTGGNVNLTVLGGEYECVFGGSKGRPVGHPEGEFDAYIEGDVNLTIRGGTIDTVFGGSNIKGNVFGKIIVNIDDAGSTECPLVIHNVYGGGRNASYTPASTTLGSYPEVNVLNGTISKSEGKGGNVFGGGYGDGATVTSTATYGPKVTIGGSSTSTDEATVEGNVYGGGHGANVVGNPHVILDGASKVNVEGNVFGGGKQAIVQGNAKVEVK